MAFSRNVLIQLKTRRSGKKILVAEMMSSEESEVDDEGDHEAYNAVIPLPWRATIVDEFF